MSGVVDGPDPRLRLRHPAARGGGRNRGHLGQLRRGCPYLHCRRAWTSGLLAPGASFRRTFASAGTFPYHCDPHPGMKASVVVQ